jgi:3-oxoacyl-[acyl-carrier protein] reductase
VDLGLSGARALVGGASTGLGYAIAAALADEGASSALVARSADRLKQVAGQIGGVAIPCDLSTATGPTDAVAGAVLALGGIDLLVVNSGGPVAGPFEELSEEQWDQAIDGTLRSALRLLRAALPHVRASARGAILIVLSSSAREPIPGLTTSNVLRPGLAGLIKSLSAEIAPVRINGIAPGRIATDRVASLDARRAQIAGIAVEEVVEQAIGRIPLGRYGEPSEVGRVGVFLLSQAASYVSGAIVQVDGGMIKALP